MITEKQMIIEEQMSSGFSSGKKSEQPDVVSFEDWAESWYNRQTSGNWITGIHRTAKYNLTRPVDKEKDFKMKINLIGRGRATGEFSSSYTEKEFEREVNRLKRDSIKSLYGQVITRLNVLLKLKIVKSGEFDYNNLEITDEMFQKMLEFMFDEKKLFRVLYSKEIELFELLLSVIDTKKLTYLNRHEDCWERIALSEREKICDILFYLVWELGWDESYFSALGFVPRESKHINRFRIVGRKFWDFDDSDLFKCRAFYDYDVRLLTPKEYRLSCSLDQIYAGISDIASYIPKEEYEDVLDRIIHKVDKINMDLEKEFGERIQHERRNWENNIDKLYSKK